jgi:hypothetical protein
MTLIRNDERQVLDSLHFKPHSAHGLGGILYYGAVVYSVLCDITDTIYSGDNSGTQIGLGTELGKS